MNVPPSGEPCVPAGGEQAASAPAQRAARGSTVERIGVLKLIIIIILKCEHYHQVGPPINPCEGRGRSIDPACQREDPLRLRLSAAPAARAHRALPAGSAAGTTTRLACERRAAIERAVRLIAIIPARIGAQRLPGKPLADICGAPMVVRVAQAASRASGIDAVVVATDDEKIAQAVRRAGFRAEMTSRDCQNGTERVAEAARALEADAFINVQGDEPLVSPHAIAALAELMRTGVPYGTLARPLQDGEAERPGVVKVVLDLHSRGLYFSRSLIPFPRTPGKVAPLAHLGLYGFSREFLQTFAKLTPTALEECEGLEQLRALAHGHPLHVRVGDWHSVAVDTPEDLEQVRALFAARLDQERRTA